MENFYEFLERFDPRIKYENYQSGKSAQIMLDRLMSAYKLGFVFCGRAFDLINRLRYLSPETKAKIVEELEAWEKKKAEEWKKL